MLFYFFLVIVKFCINGILCINGGTLPVARVPTRSSRDHPPLSQGRLQDKGMTTGGGVSAPKLSIPGIAMVINLPFDSTFKVLLCTLLMFFCDGQMQVCPLHGAGTGLYPL
jgi:hypothetical protein